MKPTEMLKEIKNLLGVELSKVELAQMTLENGTVLEAEEFAPEKEVFIITEEDKIALPVGEYSLEDGRILVVEEEGIIKEIKAQEEPAAEVEVEVEAAEEVVEEAPVAEVVEEEMGYVKKEEFKAALEEVKSMIDEIRVIVDEKKEKEEMEAQIKEELSATPASAPLKHNPEAKAKKEIFSYSNKREGSTRDRVLSKIANFK